MRAAVYLSPGRAVSGYVSAMVQGLGRHRVPCSTFSHLPDPAADFAICWGWRIGRRLKESGFDKPVLVMERGYIGDRMNVWTSLGWDGLNGKARFPEPQDGGERFWKNHGDLAKDWERFDGYYLIAGQVLGDQSLRGVDYLGWLKDTIDDLDRLGVDARFRPHPEAVRRGQEFPVPSYMVSTGGLADDLSEATCVIAYNSNATVDAVLAGVPAITTDDGAMAWDVTSHHVTAPLVMPDRNDWFCRMAWTQWTLPEIQSGKAWDVVKGAM